MGVCVRQDSADYDVRLTLILRLCLQGIAANTVAMCDVRALAGDIVILIGKDGQISAFDASRHAALLTHTVQV